MPRTSRKKDPEYSYHVMCRSISEIDLFQDDDDKQYYISLLKRYCDKHKCEIYAYSLMDNHVHLFINPGGFDISMYMHCLNSAYVGYFNRKYKRHGHLFQGRFASTIVDSDTYALTLTAYIHNNAKDIEGFNGKEEDYLYSSYGVYTGKRKDTYHIINKSFILSFFSEDSQKAALKYHAFTTSMKDTGILKEIDKSIWNAYVENEYRSEKTQITRNKRPDEVLMKVCEILGESIPGSMRIKYSRDKLKIRSFTTYAIRILCGYTYKKIGQYIGDLSLSGVVRLFNSGYQLIKNEKFYREAFDKIVAVN